MTLTCSEGPVRLLISCDMDYRKDKKYYGDTTPVAEYGTRQLATSLVKMLSGCYFGLTQCMPLYVAVFFLSLDLFVGFCFLISFFIKDFLPFRSVETVEPYLQILSLLLFSSFWFNKNKIFLKREYLFKVSKRLHEKKKRDIETPPSKNDSFLQMRFCIWT